MQVTVLSTSDVHGYILADDFRRPLRNDALGLSRAASVIQEIKQRALTDEVVMTIENGDFIQGSPLTNFIEQSAQTEIHRFEDLANTIDYDVRILGNHEFNYGRDYLERAVSPDKLLNANVLDTKTDEPFIGKPYAIFEKKGLKIGVIGLTTKYVPHWEQPEHLEGLTFKDPVQVAKNYIAQIRPMVDVLILAYHGGFAEDLETGQTLERVTGENQGVQLLQLSGVDALVTGHQHREIATVVHGVPTTQPGYRASHVGVMTLTLNEQDQIKTTTAKLIPTATYPESPAIVDLIHPLQMQLNHWLDEPMGTVGDNMRIKSHKLARLKNHPFIELVNRAQMAATGTKIANTALFNDEVRGLNRIVTRRDIMTNYIYPNTVVVEKLTGQDIKDALEVNARYFELNAAKELVINPLFIHPKMQHYNYDVWSGIDYTFDFSRPMNHRVVAISIAGQPLDLTAEYEVAMNNYRAGGAGNFPMFSMDKVVRELPIETAELIGQFIAEHPAIEIEQPTNLTTLGYRAVTDE
ncbi:bifunctional metallophosphatase/5'-nucleotidase [Weissella diestrammenae]|uniref:Bifunctional metallophosphatase/5'-nucleotidase n=1 Tax=Weissella diestrammenae TaxID=1162633 RepID=A0A7G9T6K0_9LACO|nr:bifunctional UDP-sugar hydrolase/5'-nucleotidase [Weissella diestrammenae]MCM0583219.1 bifunctional metallophosphatase/5'-nucleotidase [Weissella diestrammenae]QNN75725.1 bifunctional metallophosphatase/5'-nucleotidase [Weissella diestrammenae]